MTQTIRMVISGIPLATGIPSTGRVAVIALKTPPSEMTVTARTVISAMGRSFGWDYRVGRGLVNRVINRKLTGC